MVSGADEGSDVHDTAVETVAVSNRLLDEATAKLDALFHGIIPEKIEAVASGDAGERQFALRLNQLIDFFNEISDFINLLAQGALPPGPPPSNNFLIVPFREFYAQLIHLAWQAKQVANGDYSQRLALLGDFADAFNALIISLEQKETILLGLARTDSLTGIHNRVGLSDILAAEFYRSQRYHNPLTLVLFDIDHFKKVNDNFGHQTGDEVLKTLAALVKAHLRSTDIFGRWGGEEFLIAAPGVGCEQGLKLADKVRRLIEGHDFAEVRRVTASFGVATFQAADGLDSLIYRADMALYQAKRTGRNRVELA